MKKILLIATGGTIASIETENGLVPGLCAEKLLEMIPEVKELCEIEYVQLFNMDSTNIRPAHWLTIGEKIHDMYDKYDGFVVTHGTDTMAYTAAGLSYIIQNSIKPIVLTGAQVPINRADSDGRINLRDAIIYALDENSHNVQIVFAGSVIKGTRARKNYTKSFAAFGSINYPEIAKVQDGRVIRYIPDTLDSETKFYGYINPCVGLLKLIPGTNNKVMEFIIDNNDGLVIESFGVGGLPEYSDYYEQIKNAIEKGKLVVMTTQVTHEGSDLSMYRVGNVLKNQLNVLEAHDMTTEAAVAKLMWILGVTSNFEDAKKMFYKTVNADILMHNTNN